MSAQALLDRLEGVRSIGADRWLAKCPAHDDGRPSLSIRDVGDGRTLVHCFAGCATDEVIAAAGLDWSALFADNPQEWPEKRYRGMRLPRVRELALALGHELLVALIVLGDAVEDRPLSEADRERGREARRRIHRFLQELEHAT